MKIKLVILASLLVSSMKFYGQSAETFCANIILNGYSEKIYTTEPVSDHQLGIILKCGIKAPSSHNKQPWKFTIIKNVATMKEIINDVVPGNVVIIVSGIESENGTTPDFDCGLATQSMFISAHCLGLGSRIYGGPVETINSKRELFQIPNGYKAVAALRIGNIDRNVDAISAASPRKVAEEVINYIGNN